MRSSSLKLVVSTSAWAIFFALVAGCGADDPAMTPGGTCTLAATMADAGDLAALKANQCNVPGSMGAKKWYRLAATVPGSTDVVQLELWDQLGAFKGGAVHAGTFTISGEDAVPGTCGVCVRALGDKGDASAQEFFATSGTVVVTEVGANGQPFSATVSNVTFEQVDSATRKPVANGCTASLDRVKVSGTVVALGMGGGTGGGNGGGGNNCPIIIGD
jgi:hypothetical protein